MVVIHHVFNRFFNQMTMQYSNIYIRELGASPVKLGAVNSASGLSSTITSLPLRFLQDLYSVRKIFLFGVTLLTLVPLLYAVAYRWEFIIPTIINIYLRLPLLCTVPETLNRKEITYIHSIQRENKFARARGEGG